MKNAFNSKTILRIVGTYSRRLHAIALVAVIGFSMLSCDDGSTGGGDGGGSATNGSLTINGFPSTCNGKYVLAAFDLNDEESLVAGQNVLGNTAFCTGARIVGGSVTLKVWKASENSTTVTGYNGNDKNAEFGVTISNSPDDFIGFTGTGWVTVSFSGGKATGTIRDVFLFDW